MSFEQVKILLSVNLFPVQSNRVLFLLYFLMYSRMCALRTYFLVLLLFMFCFVLFHLIPLNLLYFISFRHDPASHLMHKTCLSIIWLNKR